MFKTLMAVAACTSALFAGAQGAEAFGPGSLARSLGQTAGIQSLAARQAILAPVDLVEFSRGNRPAAPPPGAEWSRI
ncbi:hypothetical protein AB3G45_29405 [Shinella sp. S4-D37]|uniref:hypothetical protein n=1 Tax=Shinella sp. S4-D37 TaxID=3161999 RepID=UPI003466A1A8